MNLIGLTNGTACIWTNSQVALTYLPCRVFPWRQSDGPDPIDQTYCRQTKTQYQFLEQKGDMKQVSNLVFAWNLISASFIITFLLRMVVVGSIIQTQQNSYSISHTTGWLW